MNPEEVAAWALLQEAHRRYQEVLRARCEAIEAQLNGDGTVQS